MLVDWLLSLGDQSFGAPGFQRPGSASLGGVHSDCLAAIVGDVLLRLVLCWVKSCGGDGLINRPLVEQEEGSVFVRSPLSGPL